MAHAAPYEVVMGPGEAWIAPVGTAEPKVDDTPAELVSAGWTKIGSKGNKVYMEDGVTCRRQQTINTFMGLGSLGPVKAVRSVIGFQVDIPVADISLATLRHIHNGNAVTTVAAAGAEAGYKTIAGYMDAQVANYALLVRGPSPEHAEGYGQWLVTKCFESGDASEMTYRKDGSPVAINLQFTALEDLDAEDDADRFYRFTAMHEPAGT